METGGLAISGSGKASLRSGPATYAVLALRVPDRIIEDRAPVSECGGQIDFFTSSKARGLILAAAYSGCRRGRSSPSLLVSHGFFLRLWKEIVMHDPLRPPRKSWRAPAVMLLVAALMCALSSTASAVSISYTTSGVFGSNSLSTQTFGGVTIAFTPAGGVADTPSAIDLGTFTVTGGLPPSGTITDTFTLTVNHLAPPPAGSQDFGLGTVSGTITVTSSSAFVQFTSPLSLTFATTPPVTYSITSADGGSPGRVNLKAPSVGGTTTIQGEVTAVPLPAAAWAGMALMGLVGAKKFRNSRREQLA